MKDRAPIDLIEEFVWLTNPQAAAPRTHAQHMIGVLRSCGYEIAKPHAALVAERDALREALERIHARSKSNQNDDLPECKRQMFHIESLARAALYPSHVEGK